MFDEVGLPIQKRCAVAFIDLLGVSQKIESKSQWGLDSIWLFYQHIKNEILKYNNTKIRIFSDNILICEEIDENNPQQAIKNVLDFIQVIEESQLLLGSMFVRGGFTIGDLHFEENFVYGEALLKAYELESKHAIYPRVVIDKSVIEIVGLVKTSIELDKDNQYFCNFLQVLINRRKSMYETKLSRFRGNILTNIKSNNTNPNVINKMEWMVNYYNSICVKNNLPNIITKEDIVKSGVNVENMHLVAEI